MDNKRQKWTFVAVILVSAIALTGCQPLKQKFVRKKKVKADKFVPILEPVDYKAESVSAERRYNHYYLTYRIWERELMENIQRDESDKRVREALDKLIVQLQEMDEWVSIEKKQRLNELTEKYQSMSEYFERPRPMRNVKSFESKLKRYERIMRKELKTEMVFNQDL